MEAIAVAMFQDQSGHFMKDERSVVVCAPIDEFALGEYLVRIPVERGGFGR